MVRVPRLNRPFGVLLGIALVWAVPGAVRAEEQPLAPWTPDAATLTQRGAEVGAHLEGDRLAMGETAPRPWMSSKKKMWKERFHGSGGTGTAYYGIGKSAKLNRQGLKDGMKDAAKAVAKKYKRNNLDLTLLDYGVAKGNLWILVGTVEHDESSEASLGSSTHTSSAAAKKAYDKGNNLLRQRKVKAAIAAFGECKEADPQFCMCYRSLGVAYSMLGQEEPAHVAYARFVKLCPDHNDSNKMRGIIGDYARARPSHPSSAESDYVAGAALVKRGMYNEATLEFSRCVQKDRSSCKCYRGLGISYAKLGNGPKAARYYGLYLKFCPKAPDAANIRKLLEASP